MSLRQVTALLAVVALAAALVYFHYHGGLSHPGDCPADEIAYYGGC